jgi:putative ABC transport system permease protein
MLLYALKMLAGDKLKYIGLIVALSFASFIISQQGSIFIGIMQRTFGFITDTSQPNIWVADPTVQYIADIKPLRNQDLYRVRRIEGVDWAVPMFYGTIPARLIDGTFQTCIFIGIDDATLIGGPPRMLEGKVEDLRGPDAVIVDHVGATTKLSSPGANGTTLPLRVGDCMELNDNRASVVGICQVSRTFQSQPVVYTTYNRATTFIPSQRDILSFVLVKAKDGADVEQLCQRIRGTTGLSAYSVWDFKKLTMLYYTKYTGIVINFGVAVILGIVIGIVIAGQTFFNFTVDNLPYFGIYKAMGADNKLLTKMILVQALAVSAIGWGIGIGAAAVFGYSFHNTELSFSMPFYIYLMSMMSMFFICMIAAIFSLLKVRRLDPAIVFKS